MGEQKIPIHKRTWFVVVVLIFCFPIGLVLLWKNDRYTVKNKIISTSSIFAVLFVLVILGSFAPNDVHEGEIQPPRTASSCKKKNYTEVISSFEAAGFTNVETNVIYDVVIGIFKKKDAVESVTINGETDWTRDDWYAPNAKVIVTYHAASSDEPEETSEVKIENEKKSMIDDTSQTDNWRVTVSGSVMRVKGLDEEEIVEKEDLSNAKKAISGLEGKTLQRAYQTIKKYNWNATYLDVSIDANDERDVVSKGKEYRKDYTVTKVENIDADNKTVSINFEYTPYYEARKEARERSEALSKVLKPVAAWEALQSYGKSEYPYGFKLHYLTDPINEEALDGEWLLKAGCTVTNAFGAKYKTVCEGTISGTTDNPVVEYFFVYPP